jgi:hypothetical protein
MSRVNRVLLSLSAVLVLLSIAGIFTNRNDAPPLKIEAIEAAQVSSLRISSPQSSIHLQRAAKEWMVVAPQKVRANQQRVDALLSDWSGGMVADASVPSASDKQHEAPFGLDPTHRRRLQIGSENGALLDLEIGNRVRGGSHYVRVTGNDQVFLARLPAADRLGTDLALWALRHEVTP